MSYILTAIAVFLGVSFSMVQVSIAQKADAQETDPSLVYSSPSLAIHQVTENTYLHISYLPTKSWGNVPCNGMVFINDSHVAVFDTPVSDSVSQELIGWIQDSLHGTVSAIVVNHFHNDCLGGLQAFHDAEIPSYASNKTIEFAQVDAAAIPQNGFDNKLVLNIGTAEIMNIFVGEAHTQDNIVSYVPSEKVVFGGCLVKSVDASKGYTGDANIAQWSATAQAVKEKFPRAQTIVPGHGKPGGMELLDYTMKLFKVKE